MTRLGLVTTRRSRELITASRGPRNRTDPLHRRQETGNSQGCPLRRDAVQKRPFVRSDRHREDVDWHIEALTGGSKSHGHSPPPISALAGAASQRRRVTEQSFQCGLETDIHGTVHTAMHNLQTDSSHLTRLQFYPDYIPQVASSALTFPSSIFTTLHTSHNRAWSNNRPACRWYS
jgi:hypothetical protein